MQLRESQSAGLWDWSCSSRLACLSYAWLALGWLGVPALAASTGADSWAPEDPGYLRDQAFVSDRPGKRSAWFQSQHSGEPSYSFEAVEGVLTIKRIGNEPWGRINQRISARGLAGKTLVFSADVRGNLQPQPNPEHNPTGLSVQIKGVPKGMPKMMGTVTLLTVDAEPALAPGEHPWTTQSIIFDVPENAISLEVVVTLGAPGELQVRGPRLTEAQSAPDG